MLGAIAGDIIGSVYEFDPIKTVDFPLFCKSSTFTDDTVLTVATADAILRNIDYGRSYRSFARAWPGRGYGQHFGIWLGSDSSEPYNSWGNGSAMRAGPVGFAFDSTEEVLAEAKRSAEVTHNHPEGVKGAQAAALAVYLAKAKRSKDAIRKEIRDVFGYDLDRTADQIRVHYKFDPSCQGTVPEAIVAFLESVDFESAVRLAVSLGGDSDTLACITGAIAQAFYGQLPEYIGSEVRNRLPAEFIEIIDEFTDRYIANS